MKVGYARVSTREQDLTAQRNELAALGVEPDRVYIDHGYTGRNRERPGLREALAACRQGDAFIVTKLDRLARSVPDARAIAQELADKGASLSIGGTIYNLADPMGKLFLNALSMVAEFESDLIRARTREGMAIAASKGRLRGRAPKLSPAQQRHLVKLHAEGEHSVQELAELFKVGRATVYRTIERSGDSSMTPPVPGGSPESKQ